MRYKKFHQGKRVAWLFLEGIRNILMCIHGYRCHLFLKCNQIQVVEEVDVQVVLVRMDQVVEAVGLEVELVFVHHI